ncbi:MAG: nucleoside monophosphate kinase [Candidatus Saccharibacteria bacterium]|nr:nucleoside monophosphate kinase [Candidatus Saccharibacteria bacterium]
MRIIFLGGPGSGKSTVGNRLAEDLKWPWISSGEILRQSKEPWVIEKLKTAQLFDDEMIAGLVLSRLTGVQNAILDGFPRTFKQAEIMLSRGEKVDLIVELNVPLEEVQKRLFMRGRDQDTKEIIEERLAMYEQSKSEIMAYLVGNGAKLITIDGIGSPDEVYIRVAKAIQEVIK